MRKKTARGLVAAGALAAASLFVTAAPAGAIAVSDEAGLRAAFADAAETQIDLANDITLTDCAAGDLDRASATVLTLNGHGFTITQTCTDERVMEQNGTAELILDGVTVTGGNLSAGNGGGGVWASGGGPVTLNNATVTGNSAPSTGGGGVNAETLNATNSTISGNDADDFGGGANVVTATLVNSTVSGNTSAGRGGGIAASEVTLTNSTVSGNTANGLTGGGGLFAFSVTMVYGTVAGNTAGAAANVYAETGITSFGSVVALPQGGGENCGGGGTTTSNGFNFSDDSLCGFTQSTDRQNAGDPGLSALGDFGGPTQTRLPQPEVPPENPDPFGPLIEAIPTESCQADGASGVTTDQRGVPRPQPEGIGRCDIGAVEINAVPSTAVPPPAPPGAAVPVSGTARFTG